ncbi:imidazole glycerol phosphate synthase subunit HisH [Roseospira navarrensis]|uniref:Imidazole glycerol phosphate synthase subunit HisH n=1 Tax=Roseospira navarrensis TaxID=140058 RepID=A0A7X1ZHP4_9PROT|nr:imidazole glycerol phosphate synthase subunit HisH [Roseospira navarrensis]MQX37831.1 imidazole glycerol phosphate synthase subunit HisH [Roseospira navarrensis]
MKLAIIDYGSGNLRSAAKAFERAALESRARLDIEVTDKPDLVVAADRIVLPGVGAFADCRRGLAAVDGMIDALTEAVQARARPFLGICVGMQLMAREGREHGSHPGLGWIDGVVEAVTPADPALKIPHMGWNDLIVPDARHPVLAGIATGQHAYFVHSYAMVLDDAAQGLATVEYGGPVTAMVGRDTMVGTQFHPEKSQATGLRLIANFLTWTP